MNILCICSGNTCRSPMLQTLLHAALHNAKQLDVVVSSAGTSAGDAEPASGGAQRAMTRRGLSLSGHRSRNLRLIDMTTVDLVFCMTPTHAAAVRGRGVPEAKITVVNAEGGGVPDPFGGDDEEYEVTAQVLELAAREIAQEL